MKKVHIISLMAAALLPFTTRATEVTNISDPVVNDSVPVIVDETEQAISVADTVTVNAADTVPQQAVTGQYAGKEYTFDADYFRKYRGVDFRFLKNTTNPAVKPYKFLQDQTWVGVPLFVAGIIAKGEKEAFRQNYKNTNTVLGHRADRGP